MVSERSIEELADEAVRLVLANQIDFVVTPAEARSLVVLESSEWNAHVYRAFMRADRSPRDYVGRELRVVIGAPDPHRERLTDAGQRLG